MSMVSTNKDHGRAKESIASLPIAVYKRVMRPAKQWIGSTVLRHTGKNGKANLCLLLIGPVTRTSGEQTYLLTSIEHRPSAPWHIPRICQPCREIGIADNQWQDRGCQSRCMRDTQKRSRYCCKSCVGSHFHLRVCACFTEIFGITIR